MASPALARLWRPVANSSFFHPRTQEDRNFRLLCLNTAMIGVGQGGILNFMPIFFARQGATPAMLGWLSSAPSLMIVAFGLLGASVAERYSDQARTSALYVLPVRVIFILCGLLPFWLPANRLLLPLLVIWTLRTIPLTVSIPAWTSVITRAVSPQRRSRLNGTRWAFMSLAVAISSFCSGLVLDHVRSPLNYQIVFLVSSAFLLLDPYFFSRVRVPKLEVLARAQRPNLWHVAEFVRPVLQHRPFVILLACTMVYRVTLNLPSPLFTLFWVRNLAATDTLIGLRNTVGYLALVVGYYYWGRHANRIGHRRLLRVAAVVNAFHPLLTALAPSAIWLLPIAVLWGLAAAGVDVGIFDITMASWPGERQPLFGAVWNSTSEFAIFLGPLLGAALLSVIPVGSGLLLVGALQILATLPFAALPRDS